MEQTEKTASKIIPVSFQGYKNEIYFEIVSQKQQRKRIIRGGSFVVTKMFININFKVYLVYKREYIFDSKKVRNQTEYVFQGWVIPYNDQQLTEYIIQRNGV